MIANMKTFDKLVEFKHSFVKNGFYSKHFQEIKYLGRGSYGNVFEAKRKEDSDYYVRTGIEYIFQYIKAIKATKTLKDIINIVRKRETEYSAIKRIEFGHATSVVGKDEIIREYLNFKIMTRNYSQNEYLVKHFDAWFEENQSGISLFIQMELCDKTLDYVIEKLDKCSHLKTNGTLTPVGYYIASQIFIQILEGVNYLHTQNPPLIHRDLKPANILLKKDKAKGLCVKIADFGLIALQEFLGQSHTGDKGTVKYMAPEVIYSTIYGTKADIYSLGVVWDNLLDLNMIE
jgi:serine/threonine protein kinase